MNYCGLSIFSYHLQLRCTLFCQSYKCKKDGTKLLSDYVQTMPLFSQQAQVFRQLLAASLLLTLVPLA